MTEFKKMVFRCFLAVLGGLISASAVAQTTLAAGDMAIIGVNYDVSPRKVALVTLVPLSAGTTIRITDYGV